MSSAGRHLLSMAGTQPTLARRTEERTRFGAVLVFVAVVGSAVSAAHGQDQVGDALAAPAAARSSLLQPTARYDLAVQRVALPPVESRRGSLAKVGDLLLYAAQKGRLYVIADVAVSGEFDLAIPLRHEHPLLAQGPPEWVSVFDLAAESSHTGEPGRYDIYASYLDVDEGQRCIFLALSKAVVSVSGGALNPVAGWEQVFRADPCLPVISTNSTGGRIDFDADGIVLTVGTFNSISGDYGTIVRLDRTTFDKHTISTGHRNPQGLFIDSNGTIFETEHGPQGGDEVNVIEDGRHYGWPFVTYGTDYGKKQYCGVRPCPMDAPAESQGHHLGFEQPLYAFVPSVGISQIIGVTRATEFASWRGDLLVSSMVARSLYRVHLHEQRVVVVEPIPLGASVRDMVELDDGRIVLLTDDRELLVLSNAERSPVAR